MAARVTLRDAVQGARHVVESYTWPGNLVLTGATLTGTKRMKYAAAVTAIDGTLTPDADQVANPGVFTWDYGPGDVGTPGEFFVQLKATFTDFDATIQSRWIVHGLQSASAVAAENVVGVLQSEADYLEDLVDGTAAATDGQVWTADGAGGATFEDAAGGGASDVADLTTVGMTPGNFLRVDDPGGIIQVDGPTLAAAIDNNIDILNISPTGADAGDYFRVSLGGDAIQNRTPAQVLSDIGAQASSAKLTAIAALTWAANSIILLTGTATAAVQALAAHVVTFLQSASAADARTAIGAGTGDGDVTAAAVIADNAIVRGDGGAKGVQAGTPLITDAGVIQLLASGTVYGEVSGHASSGLVLTGKTPGTAFRRVSVSGTEISFQINDQLVGLIKKLTSINATPQTIITNGAGDVTLVLSGTFTISDGAGNVAGGVITATAPGANFNLYDDGGTNTCQLQVAADGSVVVVRTAGARTYAVNLNLNWM